MVVEPGFGHFLAESDLDRRAATLPLGLLQTLEAGRAIGVSKAMFSYA